jgi:hypothetical protein
MALSQIYSSPSSPAPSCLALRQLYWSAQKHKPHRNGSRKFHMIRLLKLMVIDSTAFWQWCITHRFIGFFQSPCILENRKHDFSKTGFVSVFMLGGEDTYSVGPLRNSWFQLIQWLRPVSRLSRRCGNLDVSQPPGLPRPATGITLLLYLCI